MKFYKFALYKAYFDKGYGIMSLPKYFLILMGFGDVLATDGNTTNVIIIGTAFGIVCFFIGWFWFKYRITDAENEVNNQFNPFAREVRKKLKVNRLTE